MKHESKWILLFPALVITACHGGAHDAHDAEACPPAVKTSLATTYPDATVDACKGEHEKGHETFEAKLTRKNGDKLGVDLAADGSILQTESPIGIDAVPPAVIAAFSTKYPTAKPKKAEMQTRTGKTTTYELAFEIADKAKEATFDADGKFVGEE